MIGDNYILLSVLILMATEIGFIVWEEYKQERAYRKRLKSFETNRPYLHEYAEQSYKANARFDKQKKGVAIDNGPVNNEHKTYTTD